MAKLYTGARMTTATTGTGTITLGAAVSGYLTFAGAGVANGDVVAYGIKDGANSEWGSGTYTSSGTTLSRTLTLSTTGSLLNLSGAAEVYITPRKEDLLSITETQTANTLLCGPSSGGAAAPTFRGLVAADVPALAYVTSVSLSLPAFITVSGSPVTASGTLTGALANQNANLHFCGPSSGGAAAPTFRALVAADIPGNATGLTFLGTLTASNSASLDDTVDITSTYDEYMIVLRNVIPATTNAALLMRISTDGGATYAATTYDTMITGAFASGGAGGSGSGITETEGTGYLLSGKNVNYDGINTNSSYGVSGTLFFHNPNSTTTRKMLTGSVSWFAGVNNRREVGTVGGYYDGNNTAINAIRFLMNSGNITSGTIKIYGVKTS